MVSYRRATFTTDGGPPCHSHAPPLHHRAARPPGAREAPRGARTRAPARACPTPGAGRDGVATAGLAAPSSRTWQRRRSRSRRSSPAPPCSPPAAARPAAPPRRRALGRTAAAGSRHLRRLAQGRGRRLLGARGRRRPRRPRGCVRPRIARCSHRVLRRHRARPTAPDEARASRSRERAGPGRRARRPRRRSHAVGRAWSAHALHQPHEGAGRGWLVAGWGTSP